MTYPTKCLVEICSVRTGRRDANHGDSGGPYPFFTCADKPIKSPTYTFDGESIILPGNGANVGLVLYHSGKFEAYQRTYVLNEFKCEPRYVYHHLRCYWATINRFNQFGSATNYIRMGNFENYQIPLPPIAEQKRIAAILDKTDELRGLRRKALEELDAIVQSIFLEMFGDPLKNPKCWEFLRFQNLLNAPLRNGVSPSHSGKVTCRVLTLSAITGNEFNLNAIKTSTFQSTPPSHQTVNDNDFLICRGNGNIHLVGKGYFPTQSMPDVAFPDTMIAAQVGLDRVSQAFLQYIWNSNVVRAQIEAVARTTNGTLKVNQTMLEGISLPIPPLPLQQEFAQRVEAIEQLKATHRESLVQLDALFASLQHRAFRGEL